MRSYYTYGAIPDPVRTVRGFDDGGLAAAPEVGLAGAGGSDKPLMQQLYENGEVSEAEYRSWLNEQAAPKSSGALMQYFTPGFTLPEGVKASAAGTEMTPEQAQAGLAGMNLAKLNQERQLETGALGSFVGPTGATSPVLAGQTSLATAPKRSAAEVAADYAKATGLDLAGFAATQGKTEQQLMSDINAGEMDLGTRRGVLNQMQAQAAAGDYQGAFETARDAEARLGGDFVGNLTSPNNLQYLSKEMTPDDINNYYDALKNVIGEEEYQRRYGTTGNDFSIDRAKERSLEAAKSGTNFVDPKLGFKAEETMLGKTVDGLIKAGEVAAAIALIYGGAQALGALGTSGGTAAGTAGTAGATGTAAGTAAGTAGAAGAGAAAGTGAAAAGAYAGLPEVLVTASNAGKLSQVIGALTSAGVGTAAINSALNQIAAPSVSQPVQPTPEPAPTDLEEIVVQSGRGTGLGGFTPALATAPTAAQIASTLTPTTPPLEPVPPEAPPSDNLEEVTVQAGKVPPSPDFSWLTPTLATAPSLADIASTLTPETPPLEEPLEEVTVESKKVPPPPDFSWLAPTLAQLNPADILKDYKPTTIEDPNSLEALIKKYGTLENALKVLGLLGGAGAVTGSSTGGGGLAGKYDTSGGAGFGAGLQPVQFNRTQLNPNIDYYTYATRPEAKFFEYGSQLSQPTQPAASAPAQPSGVVTEAAGGLIDENMTGGLIGYAKGGKSHTPEDYVEGPGSGREDLIPAMLSDGEYVIDAETLALLGDGSTKEGARRMDQFRAKIRQHKGRALSRGRISPNAKSPEKYMGGGLS